MQQLISTFRGFCGSIQFPLQTFTQEAHHFACPLNGRGATTQNNWGIQYIAHGTRLPLSKPSNRYVFLAGVFEWDEPAQDVACTFAQTLSGNRYERLAPGDYCGCVVGEEEVWFFQTPSSHHTIFYMCERQCVRWSTNPRHLVSTRNLDEEALLGCCEGKDLFAYSGIKRLSAGTVVHITTTSERTTPMQQIAPLVFPRDRTELSEMARLCYEVLGEATRPLASCGRTVGVLLSGGIDSSALAAALVHNGAPVVAYHLASPGAASEVADAQAVCQRLAIPLVCVNVSSDARYVSDRWHLDHPYGHAGLRWFEQVADQLVQDGVSLLVTGRGGDPFFGPLYSYGLSTIFSSPVDWREKVAMAMGTLTTDWCLPALLKSIGTSSLISESSLTPSPHRVSPITSAPFFRRCSTLEVPSDAYDVCRFSPQDLVVEGTVWQPRGICVVHPYHHISVQRLAKSLPGAYRLLAYRGQKVTKPVLRLAFANSLPACTIRQRRGPWSSVPHQEYCIGQASYLAHIIGSETSQVVQRGFVDPHHLQRVLTNQQQIRAYYKAIIATTMTELFLRQFEDENVERG